jgi:DNA-directed RNA polymerase specialized sigma24 family protein
VDGWLTAEEELAAWEGIRLGDLDAFAALAGPLQPSLRRLARLYADDGEAAAIVRRGWRVVLGGEAMFRWQTPLATWVAAIVVDGGRNRARSRHAVTFPASALPPDPHRSLPGPSDWTDLPWSERWQGVGTRLASALHGLPLAELEVLHVRDLEGWPARRSCDLLGLPEAVQDRLLVAARGRIHDAVGRQLGVDERGGPDPDRGAQVRALVRWLGRQVEHRPEPLDPATLAVFQRWAAGSRRRWRRPARRAAGTAGRLSGRSEAPAARRVAPGSGSASARPRPT